MEKVPLFALSALSCVLTYLAQNRGGAVSSLQHVSLDLRMANSLTAYVMYLWKTLWPTGLSHFYPLTGSVNPVLLGAALLVLAGVSAMAVIMLKPRPYVAFGWLWFLGTLVPVIGLVQVGAQAMADRYTYIPLVGVFIAVAWGAVDAMERLRVRNRALAAVPAAAVLVTLAAAAWVQAGYWKDDHALFSHAIRVNNDNYIAHTNIATFYTERRQFGEAIRHFGEALRINPEDTMVMKNLGLAHLMTAQPDRSIYNYSLALKHDPDDIPALFKLGGVYGDLGETDRAIEQFTRITAIDAGNHRAFYNLGVLQAKKGDTERAMGSFNAALGISPGDADVHTALGMVLANLGRKDEAIAHFREALKSDPGNREATGFLGAAMQPGREGSGESPAADRGLSDDPGALYRSAVELASRGENDRALAVLTKLHRLQPDNPEVMYNMACLHARQGRADEAIQWLGRAVDAGFSDYALMERDPDLSGIRGTEGYGKIMKRR
jgi:tetratricopeptide (TPR) repeat protein